MGGASISTAASPCLFFGLNLSWDTERRVVNMYSGLKANEQLFFCGLRSMSLHPSVAMQFMKQDDTENNVLMVVEGLRMALPLWHCSQYKDELEALMPCLTRCVLQCDPMPQTNFSGYTFLYLRLRYDGSGLDEPFLEQVRKDLRQDDETFEHISQIKEMESDQKK